MARRLHRSRSNLWNYEQGHRLVPVDIVDAYERELHLEPGSIGGVREVARSAAGSTPGALPTGTVSFLFTDIEQSTRLWDRFPAAMAKALEEHDRILIEATTRHRGSVFANSGDGMGVAFARAAHAVAAALD